MVREKGRRRKGRVCGFTLTELIIVLAVAGLLIGGVLFVYKNRIEPTQWVNGKAEAFVNLASALENAKSMNGGGYPAATNVNLADLSNATTSQMRILAAAIGQRSPDLTGWTYSCSGGTLTITVNTGDVPGGRTDLVEALRSKIQGASAYSCTTGTGSITCTRSTVPCL